MYVAQLLHMSVYHCVKSFVKSFTSSRNLPSGFHFSFFSFVPTILLISSSSNNWRLTSVYQSFVGSIIVIANQKNTWEWEYISVRKAKHRELLSSVPSPPNNFGIWIYLTPHVSLIDLHVSCWESTGLVTLKFKYIFCINFLADQTQVPHAEPNSSNRNHIPWYSPGMVCNESHYVYAQAYLGLLKAGAGHHIRFY